MKILECNSINQFLKAQINNHSDYSDFKFFKFENVNIKKNLILTSIAFKRSGNS